LNHLQTKNWLDSNNNPGRYCNGLPSPFDPPSRRRATGRNITITGQFTARLEFNTSDIKPDCIDKLIANETIPSCNSPGVNASVDCCVAFAFDDHEIDLFFPQGTRYNFLANSTFNVTGFVEQWAVASGIDPLNVTIAAVYVDYATLMVDKRVPTFSLYSASGYSVGGGSTRTIKPAICGDGILDPFEDCDDPFSPGCVDCSAEEGWACDATGCARYDTMFNTTDQNRTSGGPGVVSTTGMGPTLSTTGMDPILSTTGSNQASTTGPGTALTSTGIAATTNIGVTSTTGTTTPSTSNAKAREVSFVHGMACLAGVSFATLLST
jgi:hypothetical protein